MPAMFQPRASCSAPNTGDPSVEPRFWQNCMMAMAMVAPMAVLRMSIGAMGRSEPPHMPPPTPCSTMTNHMTAIAPGPV